MKKIVFDFGGVLFHWKPSRLMQRELPRRATDEASGARWAEAVFRGYGGDWGEFDRGTLE
ncbi:MAG: HAD family phosphatase, partial [Chitinophagaceae bacterium]|nr:HAD family phosphatase [Rubrivivax sp.]